MDPQDAYNLICELKEFSPEYYRRIQECTGLWIEARFALIHLLEDIEKTKLLENTQNRETFTEIPPDKEVITNANIQTGALETEINEKLQQVKKALNENSKIEETVEKQSMEKAEEEKLEELRKVIQKWETPNVTQEVKKWETPNVTQEVKEKIPAAEQIKMPENTLKGAAPENREEIEKWLRNTEHQYEEMPLEMQEKTMPRYIQLRTHVCKDKVGMDSSCIGCLIGSTIDCPLFNRSSKKNAKGSKNVMQQ
jgi:hypothetical protein